MISAMSLIVVLVVAAPAPKAAEAEAAVVEPTGPAPHLTYLKADAAGNIPFQFTRAVPIQIVQNGQTVTQFVTVQEIVEIRSLKNAITTATGEKVDPAEAYKRLRTGGYVAISSDGKGVAAGYLRMLNRDVLIFASPGLAYSDPKRAAVAPVPKKKKE